MNKKIVFLSTLIVLISFFLGRAHFPLQTFKKKKVLMGTVASVSVREKSRPKADKAMDLAFKEMERLERLFSCHDETSELSILNKNGRASDLSPEIIYLLLESQKISRLSRGAFDCSVYPLVELWSEAAPDKKIPGGEKIKEVLPLVDYRQIIVEEEGKAAFLKEGMKIDLGAIAKGYAVDKAVEVLRKEKAANFLIEAGGDLYAAGSGRGSRGWLVGLKHPRKDGLIAQFLCRDKGVATSGDYERFFLVDGRRYHHILNPRTGYPSESGLISVTVIAPSSVLADALATAIFVLGKEEGLRLAENFENIEVILIAEEKNKLKLFYSGGLEIKLLSEVQAEALSF